MTIATYYFLGSIALAVGSYFLTDWYGLPSGMEVQQKRFWSGVAAASILFLGMTLTKAQSIDEEYGAMLSKMDDANLHIKDLDSTFQELQPLLGLADAYERNFHRAEQPIKSWADSLEKELTANWNSGITPLYKQDDIPVEIAQAFQAEAARRQTQPKYVIATNVVDPDFYFGDNPQARQYVDANQDAAANGVAILRYYLFDARYSHPKGIDQYFAKVKKLRQRTFAVYSSLINLDGCKMDRPRDLLLLDDGFLAETKLNYDQSVDYAQATKDPDTVRNVRSYLLDTLNNCSKAQSHVDEMSDKEMRTYAPVLYSIYDRAMPQRSGPLSRKIYEYIIRSETERLHPTIAEY